MTNSYYTPYGRNQIYRRMRESLKVAQLGTENSLCHQLWKATVTSMDIQDFPELMKHKPPQNFNRMGYWFDTWSLQGMNKRLDILSQAIKETEDAQAS